MTEFTGFVLRDVLVAPSNADTSAAPTNGVVHDVKPTPSDYDLATSNPAVVDAAADQYRAAILDDPADGGSTEYLMVAANSSQLALLEDASWVTSDGKGFYTPGNLVVGSFTDGTDRVVITDNGNRNLASIVSLQIKRGDHQLVVTVATFESTDITAGLVTLDAPTLLLLGGGISEARGDEIIAVSYVVAASRFWWTRNDRYEKRFAWDGSKQKWDFLKGSAPKNLGTLLPGVSYRLSPVPVVSIGEYLPGTEAPTGSDQYAMLRLGVEPDKNSFPIAQPGTGSPNGLLVVSDQDAEAEYSFPTVAPIPAGVVGISSGIIQWNQAFVDNWAGSEIWYSYRGFQEDADGIVGDLVSSNLFLSPIPGPTDRPLIRIGSRTHLTPLVVFTEDDLAFTSVTTGQVGVSLSTGKIKLNLLDQNKGVPVAGNLSFDKQYLDARIYYDGVALNSQPQPVKPPVALVGSSGSAEPVSGSNALYIPDAQYLQFTEGGVRYPLGRSGIIHAPDQTGSTPQDGTPGTRPGGDNPGDVSTGLVRYVTGLGDTFVFSNQGAIEKAVVVDRTTDLPSFSWDIPKGEVYIARQKSGSFGSKVALSFEDRTRLAGNFVYFQQADLTPAIYTNKAVLYSKKRDLFTFDGTEKLYFAIDKAPASPPDVWESMFLGGAGTYTAAQVATSINGIITTGGSAYSYQGRIVLSAEDPYNGVVEIGWGENTGKDLSGCAALGLLPGWRVDTTGTVKDNWLPDAGIQFGLFRSSVNLDRSGATADYQALSRIEDTVLSDPIPAQPMVFLDYAPLQDVAGYGKDVFFQLVSTIQQGDTIRLVNTKLTNYTEVLYEFDQRKFSWIDSFTQAQVVRQPTQTLPLGQLNVVPNSLLGVLGGNFELALGGGPLMPLELNTDYLLPNNGVSGTALLIDHVGGMAAQGSKGSFVADSTTFTDPNVDFNTAGVVKGYLLNVLGNVAGGYYRINSVSTNSLEVTPKFRITSGSSPVSWEVYQGQDADSFDPAIVADVLYEEFNHLPTEPFKIWTLTPIGLTPANAVVQESNRLQVDLTDIRASGKSLDVSETSTNGDVTLRYGTDQANTFYFNVLTKTELGNLANGSLFVPLSPTFPARFNTGAFSLQIGTQTFTHAAGDLVPVSIFSTPIPSGKIEYLSTTREIGFADDLLSSYQGAAVYYTEEFLDPIYLAGGNAEVRLSDGVLNFSSGGMSAFAGQKAYLVERMITEQRREVGLSPMAGAFVFNKPLRESIIVEVNYFQADVAGLKAKDDAGNDIAVTEFLPVYVRLEECTLQSDSVYSFNPTGRTLDREIDPQIYVGVNLQNYGGENTCAIDYTTNTIIFTTEVAASETVRISYAVLECFGGETTFNSSTTPVYRPPFFLERGQDSFVLETDRTGDLEPGRLLRLGGDLFYVKSATYDLVADTTVVEIFPTPQAEAGSRAPGNDALTFLSSIPVTTSVAGVSIPSAPAGFMLTLALDFAPFKKKSQEIKFSGDVRQFAVAGHLLEVDGYPFLVDSSEIAEDGLTTTVHITSPAPKEFTSGSVSNVKLSVRPLYPPFARDFLGVGPQQTAGELPQNGIIPTEDVALILFGEEDTEGNLQPGRALLANIEYSIDPNTGVIRLLAPNQQPLAPGQSIVLRYTKPTTIAPFLAQEVVNFPRYRTMFRYITIPSEQNGVLGGTLKATYTFANPDTFYFRTVPLESFLPDVAQDVLSKGRISTSGGPLLTTGASTNNYDFGNRSLSFERRDLLDIDRVARTYLHFYNRVIVAFEQIREAANGEIIGDRSGKFRFFVGSGRELPPPGYEDPITGELNPRNIWADVFSAANPGASTVLQVILTDNVVDPRSATLSNGVVDGNFLDADLLSFLLGQQGAYVRNDVDDWVLSALADTTISFALPLFFKLAAKGIFKRMGDPHLFSRIFPESARAFFTTFPGIGVDPATQDNGVYAFQKIVGSGGFFGLFSGDSRIASTFDTTIGKLANPVLGTITNVASTEVSDRRPRARVWGYSPTGYGDLSGWAADRPALIATPLMLKDFPVDSTTGLPDPTQLIAQGGTLMDLTTGDYQLSTPPWVGYADQVQVAFGLPSGTTYDVGDTATRITMPPTSRLGGVFVDEILLGCIVTFKSDDGTPITDPNQIIRLNADLLTGSSLAVTQGDTIFVIPPTGISTVPNDPPTQGDLERMANNMPNYRVGFDLGIRNKEGEVVDFSLPSFADPSLLGIREILGQHPPKPGARLEANVKFANATENPVNLPALQGLSTDDNGDYAIPYLATTNTELDRLGAVQPLLTGLDSLRSADNTLYVYPDEQLGTDGVIYPSLFNLTLPPATLISSTDTQPVTNGSTEEGIGDLGSYDLLLVEVDDSAFRVGNGAQGILSVGSVVWDNVLHKSLIEPPRFVTPSRKGDRCRYTFSNAMTHIGGGGTTGVTMQDGIVNTVLSIATVPGLVLNDGQVGSPTGGLNNLFSTSFAPYPNANTFFFKFYDPTGNLIELLIITGTLVIASGGVTFLTSQPIVDDKTITLPGVTGILPLAPPGNPPTGPYDFALSLDMAGSFPYSAQTGSETAYVDTDRLTFTESIDLTTVLPRGSQTLAGVFVDGSLDVVTVAGPTSDDITVNRTDEINGGIDFTFISRQPTGEIGTFTAFPVGEGSVKVMAWEGFGNAPVLPTLSQTLKFSAVPASPKSESILGSATGVICNGEGVCDGVAFAGYNDRITEINTSVNFAGSLAKVQPGDILVVDRAKGSAQLGTTKAGTYLVRHTVESTDLAYRYRAVTLKSALGSGAGWLPIEFPQIVSFDGTGSGTITIDRIGDLIDSPSNTWFGTTGWLYIIYINAGFNSEVLAAHYSSISQTVDGYEFSLTGGLGNYKDKDRVNIPLVNLGVAFWGKITVGDTVSGMIYLPLNINGESGLPENNTVGYTSGGTLYGFDQLTVYSDAATPRASTLTSGAGSFVTTPPIAGEMRIGQHPSQVPYVLQSTSDAVIYDQVPGYGDLSGLDKNFFGTNSFWWDGTANSLHVYEGSQCILPGDVAITSDLPTGGAAHFFAQAGIFLEPSFPRPVFNLAGTTAHIVDQAHSLTANEVGFRTSTAFGLPGGPEGVHFEVRRIRRFHPVLDQIGNNLQKLRYVYETRRGVVTNYSIDLKQIGTVTALGGTQLGEFDHADVNIHAGDTLRLYNTDGSLLDEAEILGIPSGTQLLLAKPGFTRVSPGNVAGKAFEIWLKIAPVPHEQSNQQLLDLVVDRVVHTQVPNYAAKTGGYVKDLTQGSYDLVANHLYDDNITGLGNNTFEAKGVLVGDILLIDPAGAVAGPAPISPVEYGARPFGDVSVNPRPTVHLAGMPSELDDNRGFYRVLEVNSDHLVVSGSSLLASGFSDLSDSDTIGGDRVFPNDPTQAATWGYAVYPTIRGSSANVGPFYAGREGQMDLRPTALAGTNGSPPNSFKGNYASIRPFGYQVIRPSTLFSLETVDLILTIRERMLSWIEEINVVLAGKKQGSYYIFQLDQHASDLGEPLISDSGLGLLSNPYLRSIRGLLSIAPFTNDADALSVLSRRFWLLDLRLDSTQPPGALPADPTYTEFTDPSGGGLVRPVLPDQIKIVLEQRDQFRQLRYTWLTYRTNRVEGTLAEITRFDAELPKRLEEQRQLVLRKKSLNQ